MLPSPSKGATSEYAKFLAGNQNKTDEIGGISGAGNVFLGKKEVALADYSTETGKLLFTLLKEDSLPRSELLAESILLELKGVKRLNIHKEKVQRANFVVLRRPDMASILIETGFISNPEEERKLTQFEHQEKITDAIAKGVEKYFLASPPAGTYFSARSKSVDYRVVKGDTLSGIAARFSVSLEAIKRMNGLKNDRINVGRILNIPQDTYFSARSKSVDYRVVKGDTLSGIAARFSVSLEAIKRMNGLKNERINVGRVLNIPQDTYFSARSKSVDYRVVKGDTLSGIAARFSVSLKAIKRMNGLKNDRIKLGQALVIPAR